MEVMMPEMAAMKECLDDLTMLIEDLLPATKTRSVVTAKDIARIEGVSISQLRKGGKERYLLPRFGESAYPTGTPRWNIEEYLDWRRKDPVERNNAYLASLREQVRKR